MTRLTDGHPFKLTRLALLLAALQYGVWLLLAFVRFVHVTSAGADPVPRWIDGSYAILSLPLFALPETLFAPLLTRATAWILLPLALGILNALFWGCILAWLLRRARQWSRRADSVSPAA